MMPKLRVAAAAIAVLLGISGSTAFAQKAGGILRVYNADSPPGLNIYEQGRRGARGR